jgi:hypothetical protein
MADSPTSFARYAGVARFPRAEIDLTSTTQCPACFHPITLVVCTNCDLDLAHPSAAELALVSTDAAGLLHERTELIGRIRFETAAQARQAEALAAATSAAGPATVHHPTTVVHVPVDPPAATPPASPPTAPPTVPPADGSAAPGAPRRSSVQVGLIVVGVSLVSVAAIFFLVYAFITYGIVWRSVIIGAITVAAFVAATLVRRRGLVSTAEGVAAFAVVLVYLDAFAIRANNLFDAASADPLVYWGATLVASAAGFAAWQRASAMRVASISAAIAFAPGVGLLVAGFGGAAESGARVFVSLLAVALAGLLHPLAGVRGEHKPTIAAPERAIVVSIGGLGTVAAFFAAFLVTPDTPAGASIALLALGAVAAAHVWVVVYTTDEGSDTDQTLPHTVAAFFAAAASVSVAVSIVAFSYRVSTFGGAMVGSTVVPALIAVVLGYHALRSAPTAAGIALRVAAIGTAAVSAGVLVVPIGTALTLDVVAVGRALSPGVWSRRPDDAISTGVADAAPAFVALVLVLALVAVFGRATSRFARVRGTIVWGGAALLVFAVPLLTSLAATACGWFALAAAAVGLLVWSQRTGAFAAERPVAASVAVTTTALGFALSWASIDTWLAGSVAAIALLLAARSALTPSAVVGRAALFSVAIAVGLVGAAAAGQQFGGAFALGQPYADERALWAGAVAVALFALSAVPLGRVLSSLDRRALFALGGATAVCTAPASGGSIALAVVFAAAVVGWMLAARTASNGAERAVSAFALAPALAGVLVAVDATTEVPDDLAALGLAAATTIAAAVSLAFAALRPGYDLRRAGDLGIATVAVFCVAAFALGRSDLVWLGLLLGALTALLSAVSPAGLFGVNARRKHLGWVALALATGALWWRLSETSVTAVEAYVLPLAAALAGIAALDWRARRAGATPVLAFAAMVVAIVPVALSAATDAPARAVVVGAIAAAMLLVGSVVRAGAPVRPYLDGLAVAGFASVLIVAVGQCVSLAVPATGVADTRADLWLAAALVVLVVAAVGQCSGRPGDRPGTPRAGQALAISGLAVVGIVESVLIDPTPTGFWRTVVVVAFFCAVHLGGQLLHAAPFTRATGWVALALASLTAFVALAVGSIDDVEWVSVPIAVTLLVSGAVRLRADPGLRSWPAVGAGLLVLLLPSLAESQTDSAVWRLVALGVAAVAVLAVGVVRRLQAPFVVGGVVALVHGFATFAPQLVDVYQATEWWVWIGIGGVIIFVLGARYERSLRTAKNVVASIGGLR